MSAYANNVAGTLAANIGPSDTLILLGSGQGARFPSPTPGNPQTHFYATLVHFTTQAVEIVSCSARSGDTLTVTRGRDATNAIAMVTGSVVEMRLVAQMLRDLDFASVRGVANGLATLGADVKILPAQLPTDLVRSGPNDIALAGKQPSLGFTPVQQGTGTGQLSNVIKIGWSGLQVLLTVDATDMGAILFASQAATAYQALAGRAAANGYASLDGSGLVPISQIPALGYALQTNPTINGSITMSGNLFISGAIQNPNANLVITAQGGAIYLRANNGSSTNEVVVTAGGIVDCIDLSTRSDARLKRDIARAAPRPSLADELEFVEWYWRSNGSYGKGLVAQEVREVAPEYVHEHDGVLSIDKASLMLEALLGLASRVRQLEKDR